MTPLEDNEEVKLEPEETIAERIKLNPWKRKKNKISIKNINSKQAVNQTSNIISTNKSLNNYNNLLHQRNKITKNVYNNLIKPL